MSRARRAHFKVVIFTILIASVFLMESASAERSVRKGKFKLFEGVWQITGGPLGGILMNFGAIPGARFEGIPFVLHDVNDGENESGVYGYRYGTYKVVGALVRGKFGLATPLRDPDLAAQAGLGNTGTFQFQIERGTIDRLSGVMRMPDGTSIPVEARQLEALFKATKFVLAIEPRERRVYKVGQDVTFEIEASVRGPAAVDSRQPDLVVALDNAITDITVSRTKNLAGCSVDLNRVNGQVQCAFNALGPYQETASLHVKVRVPEVLAGQRLVAGVDVVPVDGEVDHSIQIAAIPRTAGVKVKKSSTGALPAACASLAGFWTTNSGSLNLATNGRYTSIDLGTTGSGLWKCDVTDGQKFLLLGQDSPNGPFFHSRFVVSQDGSHFEGFNIFGAPYFGDKNSG